MILAPFVNFEDLGTFSQHVLKGFENATNRISGAKRAGIAAVEAKKDVDNVLARTKVLPQKLNDLRVLLQLYTIL